MAAEDVAHLARAALVGALRELGALRSESVTRAFAAVPRHRLLEEFWPIPRRERGWEAPSGPGLRIGPRADAATIALAYVDDALVTRVRDGRVTSSTSQPSLMAHMLEALELRPGMRVLEIGAGIGYNAALVAHIVGDQRLVTSVDIDEGVVAQTRRLLASAGYGAIAIVAGDGADGCAARGPYDRIVATVECPDLAPAWLEQLAEGGRLLVPLRHGVGDPLLMVERDAAAARGRCVGWSGFLSIQGRLEDHGLWPVGLAMADWPHAERPLAPDVAAAVPAGEETIDLDYYLAMADARVAGPLTLVAPGRGAATIDPAGGTLGIDADGGDLADDLVAHVRRWQALGAPRMGDFVSVFEPRDRPPPASSDRSWTIERVVHRQTLTLDR